MKKHLKSISLILAFVIHGITLKAQVPQKMGFQAVIRDAANTLIVNQPISMRVSILQGSITGASVYTETHITTTNINGLVTLEIGTGSTVSGVFASINWANGPYFIKTETDPNGGNNFSISSTSELLSVPYAFHARTSDTVLNPKFNNTLYILKQSDEIKITDTIVSIDPELIFNLQPNSTYDFEFFIFGSTTRSVVTPSGVKFTILFDGSYLDLNWIPFVKYPGVNQYGPLGIAKTAGNTFIPFNSSIGTFLINIKGVIEVGDKGGNLNFAWSQAQSVLSPTTISKNSYGILTKMK